MIWRSKAFLLVYIAAGRWSQIPLLPVVSAASRSPAFVASRSITSSKSPFTAPQASAGNKSDIVDSSLTDSAECDDPSVVARRVFATDKRPVILFE